MTLENVSANKCFGGWHKQFTHRSQVLDCGMRFAIYLPPQLEQAAPAAQADQADQADQAGGEIRVPVLYWLSGLTCTDENFMQKAGALRVAAELGVAIVAPDTSPRGEGVPDDPDGGYDFGLGAGFYINATEAPWDRHYQMYDYVVAELPALIEANFPVNTKRGISGHSMGGHGALMIALRNPARYQAVSAFSPIVNPVNCPWGQKAFRGYLGDDQAAWRQYDSVELMRDCPQDQAVPALVDQGDNDGFLAEQLKPEALSAAAKHSAYPLELRMQPGYDHSYFFIASFIEEHLRFHARHLR